MKHSLTDNECYRVFRSSAEGGFWVDLTRGTVLLSKKSAEELMEFEHNKNPMNWLRLVKVKMETVKEYTP